VLQSQLDAVMQRRFGDEAISVSGLRPDFMYATDTEIKGTFDILIERYEARVLDEWYPDLPEFSNERIALLSLAYNARSADKDSPLTPHDDRQFPSLLGPGLRNAINDGDRAEAWYQIRYLSNKEQTKGIAKRRYIESALFGLYETSSANATPDEALSIYRMYTDHQAKILAYEREQRYQEALVNAQREGAAIGVTVSTLEQAFGPAYDQLMLEYGEDAITIDYRDIQVAAEEGSFLEGHRRDGWTLSDTAPEVNDLLIGRDGNDILDGCSGENWLYGGEGDDTYTLKGDGNSINHIIDNDGNNRLILNGSVVADAIEAGNGTWTSLDGRFSFTRNSPLTITDNQTGDTIIVADHQDGEYGIHLRENANLQRIYGKKIHGDLDPQDFAPVAIANSGGHALNWRTAA
jgi:hypothetical protein